MRTNALVVGSFLLLTLFFVQFASANQFTDGVSSFFETGWDELFKPFFEFLLGGAEDVDLFLGRVIIFTILVALVWIAVKQFPGIGDNNAVVWIVSIAFGILSVRFLEPELIQAIILPYSVFGVAMTSLFPLVVYGYFVEIGLKGPRNGVLRRTAWVFATVIFIGLFFVRLDELGNLGGWIYGGSVVACLILFALDGTIQRFLFGFELRRVGAEDAQEAKDAYLLKIAELPNLIRKGVITKAEANKRKKMYAEKAAYFQTKF